MSRKRSYAEFTDTEVFIIKTLYRICKSNNGNININTKSYMDDTNKNLGKSYMDVTAQMVSHQEQRDQDSGEQQAEKKSRHLSQSISNLNDTNSAANENLGKSYMGNVNENLGKSYMGNVNENIELYESQKNQDFIMTNFNKMSDVQIIQFITFIAKYIYKIKIDGIEISTIRNIIKYR